MKARRQFSRLALAAALSTLALQAPAQQTEEPFVIGVCAHELHLRDDYSRSVKMFHQAGIESIRTDAHWAYIERKRNRLKVEPHWYDYLASTEVQGLDSLFILGYGNSFHGGGEKPRSEPVRAAFNRYVGFIAQQLRGRIKHYEVWNEWDVENPTDPQFTEDYARLITDAAGIIRQHDPDAKVLAGAVTTKGIDSGFALRLIEAGIMQSVDGLSLHPYVHCRGREENTPEAWIKWLAEVDLELSRAANQPVPLYLTEMSWPAHDGACGIDETLQAAYLARSFFLARTLPNVRGYWWYDFRNDGTDKREREHNFGLVKQDYRLKPAYWVLEAISPIIKSFSFQQQIDTSDNSVLLKFGNDEEQLLVAWSTDETRPVTITSAGKTAGAMKLLDTAQPDQGWTTAGAWQCESSADTCTARIELDEFPRIISLGKPASAGSGTLQPISTR
jgi:polysaccharide biosynthesis protein PslG